MRKLQNTRGFTLVELLIVLVFGFVSVSAVGLVVLVSLSLFKYVTA